jgi:glycerate 2-kinase
VKNVLPELASLRAAAREIYESVLASVDARRAVLDAVELRGERLRVGAEEFELGGARGGLYGVGLGKAARAMAAALDERLGARLEAGVLSGPSHGARLSDRWRVFHGGHPLPNEESVASARAAFELLAEANERRAVVIFLVSGGGSAMMESPRDPSVTLEDLREANRVLVACGAGIAEVNAVRRALSAVKGGGLSARAPLATQLTLVVSDTPDGREADVASGPTLPPADEPSDTEVVRKYDLARTLPPRVVNALGGARDSWPDACGARKSFVLLDNARAREAAARKARALGFVTEVAEDLSEQPVAEGAAESIERLHALGRRERGRGVCLVSGGEFACPVRGPGVGGRNSETALRCAFEFERLHASTNAVALCAGTDGVDGNSPAAGALADHTTIARARALGLRPERLLEDSDAHTLFRTLGDSVLTGPTGTNVRDIRILISRTSRS